MTGSNATTPTMWFGPSPTTLTLSTNGSTGTYGVTDLCEPPRDMTWVEPGFIHDVALDCYGSGFAAGDVVYYRVGASATVYTFVVPPLPGDAPTGPFSFIMASYMDGVVSSLWCRNVNMCALHA